MTAITINAKNRSIELTKTFATASSKFGTPEYDQLQQVRKDYPTYTVIQRQIKRNSNKECYKGMTYEYMEDYIMTHGSVETIQANLREFEEMRLISKCHSKAFRYPVIKSWFLQKYPEIAKFGVCGAPKTEEIGEAPTAIHA